mmetsp:Transcript_85463/g.164555  ORF Transcript_85463/g.164555 Transcript_85463/m.164555 type:complete len:210 (+) Transcript_85463:333-962(+)
MCLLNAMSGGAACTLLWSHLESGRSYLRTNLGASSLRSSKKHLAASTSRSYKWSCNTCCSSITSIPASSMQLSLASRKIRPSTTSAGAAAAADAIAGLSSSCDAGTAAGLFIGHRELSRTHHDWKSSASIALNSFRSSMCVSSCCPAWDSPKLSLLSSTCNSSRCASDSISSGCRSRWALTSLLGSTSSNSWSGTAKSPNNTPTWHLSG